MVAIGNRVHERMPRFNLTEQVVENHKAQLGKFKGSEAEHQSAADPSRDVSSKLVQRQPS